MKCTWSVLIGSRIGCPFPSLPLGRPTLTVPMSQQYGELPQRILGGLKHATQLRIFVSFVGKPIQNG